MRYISHELRTPLNTVFLGLKLLHEEMKARRNNKESLTTIEDIQQSVQVALGILNELLLFDKVESGILHLDKERIYSFFEYIHDVISPFRVQVDYPHLILIKLSRVNLRLLLLLFDLNFFCN